MASKVIRITMFKLPSKEVQEKFKELYTILTHSAVKVRSDLALVLISGAYGVLPPRKTDDVAGRLSLHPLPRSRTNLRRCPLQGLQLRS
jgi:hypothetical protein